MTFLEPVRLWLLPGVLALLAAYVVQQRRRPPYAVRFPQLDLLASLVPRSAAWRRHVAAGLLLLSLTALVAAFARPEADVRVPRERATVVVALDTSISMEATDVSPDRITAARESAAAFVAGLPASFDVGLVTFNGTATLAAPATQDRDGVVAAIRSVPLGPSTAIGEAVLTSLEVVRAVPHAPGQDPPPARIVLLSDGTNTVGRGVGPAAEAARAAGVPVSTIAYGTAEGVVQVQGELIPVPVDGPALERLAEQTGGSAYTAETSAELSEVYEDIGSQVGTTTERREVTAGVSGVALALGVGAAAASLAWGPRLP